MRLIMSAAERITSTKANEVVKKLYDGEMSKSACIKELFAGGMDIKEIAQVSGIKYNHVYNVAKNEVIVHGLEVENTGRAGGNTKKAKIITMLEEGKSVTEISKELKCLYNQVWQVAKAAGYTNKQKVLTKEV